LITMYQKIKKDFPDNLDEYSGDYIFWEMVIQCSPENKSALQQAAITLISKYFESCDIFDEPK